MGWRWWKEAVVEPASSQLTLSPHPQQHTSAVTVHTAVSYRSGDRELTGEGGRKGAQTRRERWQLILRHTQHLHLH